nr:MAG TPA: hypothetical protein [Caudoviricetes sp.]
MTTSQRENPQTRPLSVTFFPAVITLLRMGECISR